MSKRLLTIGYEGSTLADFLETLRLANVEVIIDIRDVPVSRKPGFSKGALSEALRERGIEYAHLKELGDPKEGRQAARSGDLDAFQKIYNAWIKRAESKVELKVAVAMATASTACLLCYERDQKSCHRLIVAKHMADLAEFKIIHLGVKEGAERQLKTAPKANGRQPFRKVG
jgi:uncharacterized protein (DUF488 family)